MTIVNGQLTTLNTAKDLVTVIEANPGATAILMQAETQNIRYTMDGQTPTSSLGLILIVGNDPVRFSGKLQNLKFLEVTASAKLNYALIVDKTMA